MTRKLASIQKILDISPIPDADKIEVATVLGWKCVVAKKDEFKVGDFVIYVEIDSILPAKPEFEFMKDRKYRVRTIKLRKQISQGLVLPLSVIPTSMPLRACEEGDDVTDILGVTKYDPQAEEELRDAQNGRKSWVVKFLSRYKWYRKYFLQKSKRGWPDWIKKTDEDRIQLFPRICEEEKDTAFEVTEKIDGQSATYFLKRNNTPNPFAQKFEFGVCSRKLRRNKADTSSYWIVANKYNIQAILSSIIHNYDWVVVQGEIIGTNIQGNKYGVGEYKFFAYNLIYPDRQLNYKEMKKTFENHTMGIVPLVYEDWNLPDTIDESVKASIGKSIIEPNIQREGIVVRNYEKGISFKIVNPEFLLKYGE